MSPTGHTVEYLSARGYVCDIVERRVSRIVTKDLFGMFDVIALSPEHDTVVVQCTSRSNVSSRVRKITASEYLPRVRAAGWTILVHGWDRGPDKKPRVRVVDLS